MYSEELSKLAIFQHCNGKTLSKISQNLNFPCQQCKHSWITNPKFKKSKKGPKCKINNALTKRIKRFIAKSNSDDWKVNAQKIITECLVPLKKRRMNYWLKSPITNTERYHSNYALPIKKKEQDIQSICLDWGKY